MEQPIGDGGDLEHELRAWIVRQVTHTSNGVPGEGAMMLMMILVLVVEMVLLVITCMVVVRGIIHILAVVGGRCADIFHITAVTFVYVAVAIVEASDGIEAEIGVVVVVNL